MFAIIPQVTDGWLIIMLLIGLFSGAFIGLILMGLIAAEKRFEECESCRYFKFYSLVMTEGECADCRKLWISYSNGPAAKKGTF